MLLALGSDGFGTALAMLAVVLLTQQLEGNLLQPVVLGRTTQLHPLVTMLAVVAGGAGRRRDRDAPGRAPDGRGGRRRPGPAGRGVAGGHHRHPVGVSRRRPAAPTMGSVDAPDGPDEVQRLRTERDALAQEVAALRVLDGDAPAVQAGATTVTIDLLPLLQRVLDRITAAEPELFGREISIPEVDLEDVPPGTAQRLDAAMGVEVPDDLGQITVYDRGRLRAAQDAFHRLGRLVSLVVALAAVLYLVSPRPGAVRIRRAVVAAGRSVGRAGAEGFEATPEPVVRWVAGHRLALQVGLMVGALGLLWLVDLGWLASLVVVAVAAGAVLLVSRTPPVEDHLA